MGTVNLFKLFNITADTEDKELEESYKKLKGNLNTDKERAELLENFNTIATKEKRYLYFLTSTQGFKDISDLGNELLSRPNYIGPRQWLELLE